MPSEPDAPPRAPAETPGPAPGPATRARRDPLPATIFFVVLIAFVLFPAPGYRHWDAWMTASVIHDWHGTPWKAIFFFAHPLVLPISRLFHAVLPFHDALFVGAIRESTFAALDAMLLYVLGRSLLKRRAAAFLIACAYTLPHEHWHLATRGEEKDLMTFFALLVVLPFFHLRGWAVLPFLNRFSRQTLLIATGAFLALSVAVHIQNCLLIPVVAIGMLVPWRRRDFLTALKRQVLELLLLGAATAIFGFAFFLPVAYFAIGIRSARGFADWLLEYHLSGQFLDLNYHYWQRIVQASAALREYLIGDLVPFPDKHFAIGLIALFPIVAYRATRAHAGAALSILVALGIMGAHFFNYHQEPEPWGGAIPFGVVLIALATFGVGPKPRYWAHALFGVACLGFLYLDVATFLEDAPTARILFAENRPSAPPTTALEQRFEALVPESQMALRVDAALEPDAVLLVEDRLIASAFRVYTARTVIVPQYLDRDEDYYSDPDVALTILSRHFYLPETNSRAILESTRQGHPLYDLTDGAKPERYVRKLFRGDWNVALDVGMGNFRVLRYHPDSD